MNVFIFRCKPERRSKNRTQEALDRNEVWIGWQAKKDLKKLGLSRPFEQLRSGLKDRRRSGSEAKQIALFACGDVMKPGDILLVSRRLRSKTYTYYAGRVESEPEFLSVGFPEMKEALGRIMYWFNHKRPFDDLQAPPGVRKYFSHQVTVERIEPADIDRGWLSKLLGQEAQQVKLDRELPLLLQEPSSGQGFQTDTKVNRAVEQRAMRRAEAYLRREGYKNIRNTSLNQPYDFECERGDRKIYMEVKGTQLNGDTVLLTRREKEHLERHAGDWLLFVVSGIKISIGGRRDAHGGEDRVIGGRRLLNKGRFRPMLWEVMLP